MIPIQPGEIQRWRITNANDNPILDLELQGHKVYLLAQDGNTLERMEPRDHLLLGPSQRREILVQGGPEGDYNFRTRAFSQFQGGGAPAERIATMVSAGQQVDDVIPVGVQLSDPEDLREEPVAEQHEVVFSEAPKPHTHGTETDFLINGELFDPDVVEQTMKINEVQSGRSRTRRPNGTPSTSTSATSRSPGLRASHRRMCQPRTRSRSASGRTRTPPPFRRARRSPS